MIKRLLSLLAFSALFATAALFVAPQSVEVGNLVKPTELTVQAQDLKPVSYTHLTLPTKA